MKIIIASDFHLCFINDTQEKREREDRVIKFIGSLIGNTDVLILAGDVFDLWFDWSNTIIKGYFPFLKKLADLKESGCKIIFVAGNHDFWFGDFLVKYLEAEIFLEDFYANYDGKRVFVTHGDKHTHNDARYKMFRTFIRMPVMKTLFSLLHPNLALSLGAKLSRTSRKRGREQSIAASKRSQGLELFAKQNSQKYDYILMGHSHQPVEKQLGQATYFNTGDWIWHNTYVEIKDGLAQLLTFAPGHQ